LENPGGGPQNHGRNQHRSGNCKTHVFEHGSLLLPLSTLGAHICWTGANRCDPDHMSCVSRGYRQGRRGRRSFPFSLPISIQCLKAICLMEVVT
jgi:hypothetical protein